MTNSNEKQLDLPGIEPKRLDPNGALVDIKGAARIAGVSHWAYRRTILINPSHPEAVSVGRPALYRRSDINEFLGVREQLELDL